MFPNYNKKKDMKRNQIKVESGIQLLSRLTTKKKKLQNFYPSLFESAPKPEDVVEIFSNTSSSFLLIDMICEAVIPMKYGGAGAAVLIINTDGHITEQALTTSLNQKLKSRIKLNTNDHLQTLNDLLLNLFIMNIFDATQLYTALQNLENVMLRHRNISLCVIDTLTAFYWSEQNFKISKMDCYLKHVLGMFQKATKGLEIIILYTRPEYFNSTKDLIENLEACCENPTAERVNMRIKLECYEAEICTAYVKCFNSNILKRHFRIDHNQIVWI